MKNIAVITGASSGIGETYLRRLIASALPFNGRPIDEYWLIARRDDRLIALRRELGENRIRVLPADLSARDGLVAVSDAFREADVEIALLINCAGMGRYGEFCDASSDEIQKTVALNCAALSEMIYLCLRFMPSAKVGKSLSQGPRIVNIASSAAFLPQPGFAVYAASKSYVLSLSRALSCEFRPFGVGVTAVCPGPVATDFIFCASGGKSAKPTGIKALFVTQADDLVSRSLRSIRRGRPVYIHGFSQKLLYLCAKVVPTGLMVRLIRKAGGSSGT